MQLKPTAINVGVGRVVALVVKSNGAVAWIAENDERTLAPESPSEVNYFDLESVDKSGIHLLASGPGIDPSSLALAGSRLY